MCSDNIKRDNLKNYDGKNICSLEDTSKNWHMEAGYKRSFVVFFFAYRRKWQLAKEIRIIWIMNSTKFSSYKNVKQNSIDSLDQRSICT